MLAVLSSAGCLGANVLTEPAVYEIQVREPWGPFVQGARVVARPLTWGDGRTVEARTDARGRCELEVRQSTLGGKGIRGSDLRALPWLSVAVEADGFEGRAFFFTRDDFVDDGGKLRRAEAVTLVRTSK